MDIGKDHCRVIPPIEKETGFKKFEYLRHMYGYTLVPDIKKNVHIGEIGSGEGYGTRYLSEYPIKIVAIDIMKYPPYPGQQKPSNIEYFQALGTHLPFRSDLFDCVISFQVIEHIQNEKMFLNEIHRVLKNGGNVLITTPNRKLRLFPFQKPRNPYHIHEYSGKELYRLLRKFFDSVTILGIKTRPDLMDAEIARVKPSLLSLLPQKINLLTSRYRGEKFRAVLEYSRRRTLSENTDGFSNVELEDFYLSEDFNSGLDIVVYAKK